MALVPCLYAASAAGATRIVWHKCQMAELMAKERLVKDQDKVIVRLPDGLRDRIKAQAKSNDRSMNSEIVSLIESALSEIELFEAELANDPEAIEEISSELAIAESVGQKTGTPANVIFMGRLLARTEAMQKNIEKKLERLAIRSAISAFTSYVRKFANQHVWNTGHNPTPEEEASRTKAVLEICDRMDALAADPDARFPDFEALRFEMGPGPSAVPPGVLQAVADAFRDAGRLDRA